MTPEKSPLTPVKERSGGLHGGSQMVTPVKGKHLQAAEKEEFSSNV